MHHLLVKTLKYVCVCDVIGFYLFFTILKWREQWIDFQHYQKYRVKLLSCRQSKLKSNFNWNRKKKLSTVHEYEILHAAKQFSLIQVINATTSDVTCQAWVTRAFANPNKDESKKKKTNKPGKQRHNCKLDFCVKWISYMIFDGMSAFDLLHECNTTIQRKCGAI